MSHRTILRDLKKMQLKNMDVSLAIVKEYKVNRVSKYTIKYVPIDEPLEKRLRRTITNQIEHANSVQDYTFDCPEPEEDEVCAINYTETDFYRILEELTSLNPEEDVIEGVNDLVNSTKAYLIILRDKEGIQVVGFKTIPENWKMKKNKGLIPLLYRENRFEDLEDENVFSISNFVDFLYFNETVFILSKKAFEHGLNFRKGMMAKADEMYAELKTLNLFLNMELLISRVSNNQRYLRKIATIKNLGHYKNDHFLKKMKEISNTKNWNIQFDSDQIIFTEETLDTILSILQNKRLHSEITLEDFDVDGKIAPVS